MFYWAETKIRPRSTLPLPTILQTFLGEEFPSSLRHIPLKAIPFTCPILFKGAITINRSIALTKQSFSLLSSCLPNFSCRRIAEVCDDRLRGHTTTLVTKIVYNYLGWFFWKGPNNCRWNTSCVFLFTFLGNRHWKHVQLKHCIDLDNDDTSIQQV